MRTRACACERRNNANFPESAVTPPTFPLTFANCGPPHLPFLFSPYVLQPQSLTSSRKWLISHKMCLIFQVMSDVFSKMCLVF